MCLVTADAYASAEIWSHNVSSDVGRDSMTVEPAPGFRMVSEWTWNNHIVSNTVFDAGGNLHVNSQYASTGMVNGQFWQWNGVEWILTYEWHQKLIAVGGYSDLIRDFFSEPQTTRQIDVHNEHFQAVVRDPVTGEVVSTVEYTVIAHLLMKWLNGEAQFELSWTHNRP
jgi:hypothetical protein